ncbi:hypothetical protein LOZ65_000884 [Ophidiomyces ophidiicola]|nr:hypothetical protein LOZ65_000884 [Ophidiomyces ophidiicola]
MECERPHFDDPALTIFSSLMKQHKADTSMEIPCHPLLGNLSVYREHSDCASSSLVGTASSLGRAAEDTRESCFHSDSDSDVDSFPNTPNGLQVTPIVGCHMSDLMMSRENVLKLDSRYKNQLSAIRNERDQAIDRWRQENVINRRLIEALQFEKQKLDSVKNYLKLCVSTEIVHIPAWPPCTPLTPPPSVRRSTAPSNQHMSEDQHIRFLYDNPLYQGYELNVNIILLRVKSLVENNYPVKALTLIEEALEKASKLNYTPIYAKCLYWKGRILYLKGCQSDAIKLFRDAMPCIGIYKEGEDLKCWLLKLDDCRHSYCDNQSGSDAESPLCSRRRNYKNTCVPAAELPLTP